MVLYSHSRISTFENCPLKYKFHYLDKIECEVCENIEAFMGKMVHETLEKLYTDLKFQKMPKLNEVKDDLKGLWEKNYNDSIKIVKKGYESENYLKMALKFVEDYYESNKPFNDGVTIGTEMRIVINLDDEGKYKLQGYIDRLTCVNNEEYHIVDYKTNSHLKLQEQLDDDRQLALYQIAVQNQFKDAKKVLLKWHFLAFNKALTSTRSKEDLEKLKINTINLIKKIESAKKYEAKKSSLCDWCEFRGICPEWSHLVELESKTSKQYLNDDGVKLVNSYIKLNEQKKEIEKQLDDIKQDLIEFSKQKGVEVVFGSNNKIKVKMDESYKFPGKGTEEREELMKLLKKIKKYEEVVDLDIFSLKKIMKEELWTKEELKQLKKFAEKTQSTTIYPSKINKNEE